MKIKNLHIVFSLLMLANLLFIQIVPDYLHTHDKGSQEFCQDIHDEVVLQNDIEECKLCSIDLFHDLFFLEITEVVFDNSFESDWSIAKTQDTHSLIFSTTGRSPPLVFQS